MSINNGDELETVQPRLQQIINTLESSDWKDIKSKEDFIQDQTKLYVFQQNLTINFLEAWVGKAKQNEASLKTGIKNLEEGLKQVNSYAEATKKIRKFLSIFS
ncbi:hypothetical protein [Nostoc sp.]|uniref:hypothetical protein n=1 Tax=Nostoc sp. TaxID=1180 RepID=UPI002FF4B6AF